MRKWTELHVPVTASAATTALVYRADTDTPPATLVLAHGAGAGQQHPFMTAFADAIAARGIDVVTFNFLYTEQRRRLPDRAPALEACYRAVVDRVRADRASAGRGLFIGGKSMGGRIATHVAAADPDLRVDGIVLLGYPLHPPNRPEQRRDEHLPRVRRPMLFVQGSRDALGTAQELDAVVARLESATLHVIDGGDHSFAPSRKDPARQAALYDDAQQTVADWIYRVLSNTSPAEVKP